MIGAHVSPRARQRGVAVITAMLVVTIATVLAVQLVWETSLDLRRTEDMLLWDQAQQYAFGAESWAADILRKDLEDDGGEAIDHLDENWALQIPALSIEGGLMEGRMEDMQGRFNLNNLVNARGEKEEKALTHFRRLLEVLEVRPDAAARIAAGTVDWIDTDTVAEFDGAEDDTYTSRIPAHRAANFWFTSESELLTIEGMTPEIFAKVSPFVAALPPGTKINLNTAPPAVLRSLQADIGDGGDDRWDADRKKEPCRDPINLSITIDPDFQNFVGCASSHFGLRVNVRIGTTDLSMYSLLQRNGPSVLTRIRSFARELI